MKRLVLVPVLALLIAGCSTLTSQVGSFVGITNSHPAWACNSSYAGPMAAAIASLLTGSVAGVSAATSIGVNACQAEASLANGPPAVVTTTQSSSSVVQAPVAPANAPPAPTPSAAPTP
jgi:hypothetical protein